MSTNEEREFHIRKYNTDHPPQRLTIQIDINNADISEQQKRELTILFNALTQLLASSISLNGKSQEDALSTSAQQLVNTIEARQDVLNMRSRLLLQEQLRAKFPSKHGNR